MIKSSDEMTNREKLEELYKRKVSEEGLVDVKFSFSNITTDTSPEDVFGEILEIEEAITQGKISNLNFNDSTNRINYKTVWKE